MSNESTNVKAADGAATAATASDQAKNEAMPKAEASSAPSVPDDVSAPVAESPAPSADSKAAAPEDGEAETKGKVESPEPEAGSDGEDGDEDDEEAAEDDKPPVALIGGIVIATLAIVFAIVIGINQLFRSVMTTEVQAKLLSQTSSELRELRADEEAKLTRYQWVSQKDNVVRIPVERAIQLTIVDYANKSQAPKARGDTPGR